MESNRKQQLLDKYWEAESTTDEESILKNKAYELNDPERKYFQVLDQFDEISLDESFDEAVMTQIESSGEHGWSFKSYWKIAATVVVLLVSSLIIIEFQERRSEKLLAQQEARQAFEAAKQALMLVSVNLNKGTDYTYELSRFDQAKTKINKF